MNKQLKHDEIDKIIKKLKKEKKKIVLVHGVFDLLHIGHIKYFKKAKSYGNILIVSVTSNHYVNKGPSRPYFDEKLRMEFIEQIDCVDYVAISESENAKSIISKVKPNFYIKGNDYKKVKKTDKNLQEEIKATKRNGGKFLILKEILFSSSKLINENLNNQKKNHLKIIKSLKLKNLIEDIKNLKKKKVLIFGDQIIDQFTFVKSLGKSRKNNIISTRYINKESQLGGSFFIYKNIKQYFKNADFLNLCSVDEKNNRYIPKDTKKIIVKNNSLIYKNRYVDFYNLTKIFQENRNDKIELNKLDNFKIINYLKKIIKNYDAIVICDFGHGIFKGKILDFINKSKIFKIINCQTNSSNFGFNKYTKYKNADVLTCDEDEFRLSLENENENIEKLLKNNSFPYKKFIVTSGKNGCYLKAGKTIKFVESFEIQNFVDSIGSGDVFFSYFTVLNYLKSYSTEEKLLLSHLSAAIHSQTFANREIVSEEKFYKSIKTLLS